MDIWFSTIYEIAVLILFLVGFMWLAWLKFERAIYVVIFLLPLYLVRVKISFLPLNVLEIMVWLLAAIWLAKGRYKSFEWGGCKKMIWPAAVILAAGALCAAFSQDLRTSAGALKGWFFAPLAFGFIVLAELETKEQAKKIFLALAASGAGVGIISIFCWLGGRTTFDGRLAGIFLSPNYLAMYLAPAFLAGIGLFVLGERKTRNKVFLGCVVALNALALYLTFSYAAWISVLLAVLFMLALMFKSSGSSKNIKLFTPTPECHGREPINEWLGTRRLLPQSHRRNSAVWGFTVYCLLFIVMLTAVFVSQAGSEKLENLLHSARSSWQSRLMIWQAALLIGKDHPILGIGPGMFQDYYLKYQSRFDTPYFEWAVPQPHNIFLAFWLETGLLGLAGFIWLVIVFFRETAAAIKKKNVLALISVSLTVYFLLHGLVDTTYFKNDLAILFWLAVVTGISANKIAESKN